MHVENIKYSLRQIHFKEDDKFNPENLQKIAQHFRVGNSRACQFCLFFVYDLESHQEVFNYMTESPKLVKKLFLAFKPQQLTKAEAKAHNLGINLGELCKRAILEVADLMDTGEFEDYHPKVLKFFPSSEKSSIELAKAYLNQKNDE